MNRYAVPVVLALWAVMIALGCNWLAVPIVLLALAAVVQVYALARTYREHHRRSL